MRYCNPQRKHFQKRGGKPGEMVSAWDFTGASHLEELEELLRDKVMIRRTKQEVLTDLPDYQSVTIPFEVDLTAYNVQLEASRAELRRRRDELLAERHRLEGLSEEEQTKALAARAEENSQVKLYGYMIQEITLLKKEAGLAKVPQVVEWVSDVIEAEVPIVLFCHHHEVTDKLDAALRERFPDLNFAPICDGRLSQKLRTETAEAFGDGKYPVLIAGIMAMGTGIDGLQRSSSHCAFVELAWSPADHDQASSRLHRMGQPNAVTGYYLLSAGTIEEKIARLVDSKSTVTSAAMGEFDALGIIESLTEVIDDILGEGE